MKAALEDAIDAGTKACDLYEIALEDVISRNNLRDFLRAAIAEYMDRVKPRKAVHLKKRL